MYSLICYLALLHKHITEQWILFLTNTFYVDCSCIHKNGSKYIYIYICLCMNMLHFAVYQNMFNLVTMCNLYWYPECFDYHCILTDLTLSACVSATACACMWWKMICKYLPYLVIKINDKIAECIFFIIIQFSCDNNKIYFILLS